MLLPPLLGELIDGEELLLGADIVFLDGEDMFLEGAVLFIFVFVFPLL